MHILDTVTWEEIRSLAFLNRAFGEAESSSWSLGKEEGWEVCALAIE